MGRLVRCLRPRLHLALSLLIALTFLLAVSPATAQPLVPREQKEAKQSQQPRGEYVPDELLVRFAPSVPSDKAEEAVRSQGAASLRKVERLRVHVLRLKAGENVAEAAAKFQRLPGVEFAEPNYIFKIAQVSDPRLANQWAPQMMALPAAWQITTGQASTVIAVVDTGVDRRHPALDPGKWVNPDEIAGNGVDDDGNGFVDDVYGWDFQNSDNDPLDDHFHGTHVAGIAAGRYDGTAAGMLGVCPGCQVMAVKVLDSQGSGTLDNVASGVVYAADNGAKVINLSLGASTGAVTLQNAVDYAWSRGALVVAAAGNNGDGTILYPAGYANAMAIASSNSADQHSCFSNFGDNYVSVTAPGEVIYSTTPLNAAGEPTYATYSGTSMATPHAAGLAGLLFSQDSSRDNVAVRALMEATTEDLGPVGRDAHFGTGRLNAYRALTNDRSATPPPEGMFSDDLWASGYAYGRKLVRDASGNLHMVWHGRSGGQYRVLYASRASGSSEWGAPQVLFASAADTFSPVITADDQYLYVAFPTLEGGNKYRTMFTRRALAGGDWSSPRPAIAGNYNAARPDLFLDPTNGRLHLVTTGLDEDGRVFYAQSSDGGLNWSSPSVLDVGAQVSGSTRYASVYAAGERLVVAGRTVNMLFGGLIPEFHLFVTSSTDSGATWAPPADLAGYMGFTSEHGASLAGAAGQLTLAYENAGNVVLRSSADGVSWSSPETVGAGGWPSVTQADDGQIWVAWENEGSLMLRRKAEGAWDSAETVFTATGLRKAYYPNLKLGTSGGQVEWAATRCNGSPYALLTDSRALSAMPDRPTVQFSAAEYAVGEGAGNATATVSLGAATTQSVSVAYTTADGTAKAGSDYTTTKGTLTFAPGEVSRSFTVPIKQDTLDEPAETVVLTLSSPVNAKLGEQATSQIVIEDDDAPPKVYFSGTNYSVNENAATATATVRLSGASGLPVSVDYATANGTALADSDYTATSGTLTFNPGETSKTFAVPILEDALPEANETVALSLANPQNATLGSPATATVTILANDSVMLGSSTYYVHENADQASVVVKLNAPSSSPVTVDYYTGDGTAKAGSDYAPTNGTLTFNPGETSKTVAVPIVDDTVGEPQEAFTFGIRNAVGAGVGSPATANVNIWANDSLTFSTSNYSVQENAGQVTVTVRLSGPSSDTVAVDYATSDGSAMAGSDYTATSGTLSFAPGETSKAFAVPLLEDVLPEGSETINVALSNPANATLGSPATSVLTIPANDTLTLSASTYTVQENAGQVTVTVRLNAPASASVSVDYATTDKTALAGSDYTATSGTLTFNPGETSKTFVVPIVDDFVGEPSETFTVTLANPVNAGLGSPASATVTIGASDSLYFSGSGYSVHENAGSVTLTVRLSGPASGEVRVDWATANGTATGGSDFTPSTGTLVFAPGDTTETFAVPILEDTLSEPNETFTVSLRNPAQSDLGSAATATVTINANDTLTVGAGTYNVQENAGNANVVVRLNAASSATVAIEYFTADGTAKAGSDYTATSGTLTFAPGETSKTVAVPIVDDTAGEPQEAFTFGIRNAVNAGVGSPATATVNILANDTLNFSSAAYTVSETAGQATITVRLSGPSSVPVTVNYASANGTATAGADYTAVSGTLTFNPGETSKTFAVPIIDDTLKEVAETITLSLSSPTNASLGTIPTAKLTISASD